ncbi:hypothetical protein LUZ60_000569 [Juncus effusus]|nr:hypothetical protein LUZ60_000569 [Juncus effusus]
MLSLHCRCLSSHFSPPFSLHPKTQKPTTNPPFTIQKRKNRSRAIRVSCSFLPVDPWAPTIDSQSIASQLFAVSLFPYLGFLYFITKSKTAPKLTLFGFYFLLAFVGATIPAGIYAKLHYGTSLSNVDWLHGSAESLLTFTNLFIVLGLREALRKLENGSEKRSPQISSEEIKEKSSFMGELCLQQNSRVLLCWT